MFEGIKSMNQTAGPTVSDYAKRFAKKPFSSAMIGPEGPDASGPGAAARLEAFLAAAKAKGSGIAAVPSGGRPGPDPSMLGRLPPAMLDKAAKALVGAVSKELQADQAAAKANRKERPTSSFTAPDRDKVRGGCTCTRHTAGKLQPCRLSHVG